MSLASGARLGPYEIRGVIGVGGMGEVYRARDTKLQRDVAIKVLSVATAAGTTRLARFEREARTLAALNHPNIATVYGVEEPPVAPPGADPAPGLAIIMELVEGEDLAARLRQGPLALAEALGIARQVAEALAAAHEAGIVHRDLKPANIKVRGDGTVKVLDFGLAKGGGADSGARSEAASGSGPGPGDVPPTLTIDDDLTKDGAVLGTAAYMAPEQAMGKAVDKRADIWAFGVVLFELIAGRRPFAADTDLTDPNWAALPSSTPASIRRLLARCLTFDRKHRLHDMADARLEIDEALAHGLLGDPPRAIAGAPERRRLRRVWLPFAGVLAGLALGVTAWQAFSPTSPVTHAALDVGPADELDAGGVHPSIVLPRGGARTALAWSLDGRTLAFIGVRNGVRQIYVRDLASDRARPLGGTEGARALAFSPDGRQIAFWARGGLSKVNVAGGPTAGICEVSIVQGITWGPTRIVFVEAPNLFAVSPAGGAPQQISFPPELVRHASPFLLPGDRALLYTEYQKQWTSGDERVMVQSLDAGAVPKVLLTEAADARYLPTGHLAFLRQGTLFVAPFDAASLELLAEPVAVLERVAQSVAAWDSDDLTLAGQFAIAPDGTLAWVSSPLTSYPDRELVSVDRQGRITPLGAPAAGYRNHVDVSPDGTRIAVSIQTTTDVRVFAYDLTRGSLARVAEALRGEAVLAAWSRDDRIAVQVIDAGKITAALVRPDAASPVDPVPGSVGFWAGSLSAQGRLVGMKEGNLWIYPAAGQPDVPAAFLSTTATETQPGWSPDGRWLAYTSDTTGRPEVYLRPFPGPGDAVMVSTAGGSSPGWNPNGRELFFIEPGPDADRMMSVRLLASGHPENPVPLFAVERGLFQGTTVLTPYAVAPGGDRFYTVRPLPQPALPVTDIRVVFNWFEELRTKAPTGPYRD